MDGHSKLASVELKHYLQFGPHVEYTTQKAPWSGRQCFCGPAPRKEAKFGDLWFDTVELSLAVLIPNTPGRSEQAIVWVSTHPVFVWKFRTFLRLVHRGRARTPIPFRDDYLSPHRFQDLRSTDYITDVYQDEAVAYVRWFGKFLTSQIDLANAMAYLKPETFSAVFPSEMQLWDGSEDIEEIRLAISHSSVARLPAEEIQMWMRGQRSSGSIRIVYAEWEKSH